MLRDEARVRGDGRPVVAGRVRDVHPGELADRRSGTRRSPAGRPGSSRAGTACTPSGTRRAGAPRRRSPARSGRRSPAPRNDSSLVVSTLRAASSSRCRCSSGSVSGGSRSSSRSKRTPGRDVAEELVDGIDADLREHRLAVGVGQREVAHCVFEDLPVRRDVEQRVDLGRVAEADPDEPARRRTDPRSRSRARRRPSGSPRAPRPRAARSDPTRPSPTRPRRTTRPSRSSSPRRAPRSGRARRARPARTR